MWGMLPMSSVAAGRLMPAAMNMPSSSLLVSRAPMASDTVSGTPPALASLSSSFGSFMCTVSLSACPGWNGRALLLLLHTSCQGRVS